MSITYRNRFSSLTTIEEPWRCVNCGSSVGFKMEWHLSADHPLAPKEMHYDLVNGGTVVCADCATQIESDRWK